MTLDLSQVAFFDGHLHPPLRTTPGDPGEFRWLWYEGRPDYSELVVDILPYRGAMQVLGQREQGEAREIDLIARLAETDVLERLSQIVAAHNVVGLVLDTGYPPPEVSLSSAAIAAAAGCPVATLLRIEVAAEGLVEESNGFEDFVERFDATLAGARAEGYTGLKSVIAYRSGMAVEPPDGAAARDAVEAGLRAGARRLTAKPLLDFLLARALAAARRDALPFQFHAGYGDREIDLENANPLKLRPLLESGMADGVELVFLHGAWPYTREAAWLAAVYPTVYLDISTCIPPIGMHDLVGMWNAALSVAPVSRIHASSDAAGIPEQIAAAAVRARLSLAESLAGLVRLGEIRAGEAEQIADQVLRATSARLYAPR